jgi:hypothetical protein
MQHGLQQKKHGHWKTAVHTTQHAWACPFGFLFFCFLFFLSFYFPFFDFSFFIYPTGQTTRPRRTGGGAGQNASAQDAACRVTGWAALFFLETLTNPKQDIAAAVRRPKQRETRRRLGPAAHRTERKAVERRKKQRKHNVSSNDQRTSTQIQQHKD